MSQFKYEKLILDTAKALQCFIEEYKRDRPKFLNNNNNDNNQQQPQIGELTEDKVKLITTYALLNLTNVNNQKDFNLAVERYLNDLRTSEDGKTYVRYNNTWKEVNLNDLQGRPGRDGYTPYIQNGKWFLNNVDLGVNATGESAYDIAKRLNKPNTDSEENWVNSLKGNKGEQGEKGLKGDKGTGISSITLSNETDKTYLNINLEDNTNSKLLLPLLKGDKGEPGIDVDPAVINRINQEIDKKVDKVNGKQLSTNDFTTAEKQKLESIDLSTKLDKGTYSGTAKDLNDKIEQILTLLSSNNVNLDTLQEIVDFITLNRSKLETLGISNIAGLTQALSDKAPLNHNHDDRYMLKEHKPTWNDVQNKPDNLATSGNIQDLQRKIDQVNSVLSQKTSTNHTHNWNDIQSKPSINKSGNVYTIPGIGGNIEIPSWVGSNKPVYNWGDIQNKPELNYLPLTGGTVTGNINLNGSLLINDKTRVEVRNNGNIVFGNKPFNDLVIGEFKGIQLWGQGNDKVVLAGGGVKDISDFATTQSVKSSIDEIQIGGRNFLRETANFTLKDEHYFLQQNYNGNAGFVNETFRGNKVIKLIHNWQGFQCKTDLENRPTIISFWAKTTKPNINIYYIVGISSVTFPDGDTLISDGQWHRYTIFGKNGIKLYNNGNQGFVEFNRTSGEHIEEVLVSSFKIEYGNKATDWSPAPEDLIVKKDWEKQQHSLYGESLVTMLASVQREVVIDIGTSRNNMWTDNNELNVGSRNIGGYAKIYCNGYKIHDKDDDDLLTADGNSITKSELLALPRGYDTSTSVELPATTVNDTVFVKASITLGLKNIPDKGSVSFLKTFDGGSVTFICAGKNIVYTGDNAFDGKDGSTATVTIFDNKCYIRISNI